MKGKLRPERAERWFPIMTPEEEKAMLARYETCVRDVVSTHPRGLRPVNTKKEILVLGAGGSYRQMIRQKGDEGWLPDFVNNRTLITCDRLYQELLSWPLYPDFILRLEDGADVEGFYRARATDFQRSKAIFSSLVHKDIQVLPFSSVSVFHPLCPQPFMELLTGCLPKVPVLDSSGHVGGAALAFATEWCPNAKRVYFLGIDLDENHSKYFRPTVEYLKAHKGEKEYVDLSAENRVGGALKLA